MPYDSNMKVTKTYTNVTEIILQEFTIKRKATNS